jgi:hypothetical protein
LGHSAARAYIGGLEGVGQVGDEHGGRAVPSSSPSGVRVAFPGGGFSAAAAAAAALLPLAHRRRRGGTVGASRRRWMRREVWFFVGLRVYGCEKIGGLLWALRK